MLLISGQPVVGVGLELLLTAHRLRVVATARDALAAIRALQGTRPSLALLDLNLGDEAHTCVQVLADASPMLPIMAFGDRRPWPLQELFGAGLRGFALTSTEPEAFVAAIDVVAAGQTYLDPAFAMADRGDAGRSGRPALSPREREIMGLLALGLSGQEMALRLALSQATVRTHIQNAMRKLGARTRSHAVAILSREADPAGGDGIRLAG